jgi:hypothetical protein
VGGIQADGPRRHVSVNLAPFTHIIQMAELRDQLKKGVKACIEVVLGDSDTLIETLQGRWHNVMLGC